MKYRKLLVFMVFAVFLCISTVGSVSADDTGSNATNNTGLADSAWPTYQNNNNHTGQSSYTGPQTNTTKWEYSDDSHVSVIGSDGIIYVGSTNGNVNALYSNGTVKWTSTLQSSVGGLAIGNNETLYVTTSSALYALNSGNGTILWECTASTGSDFYPIIGSDGTIYTKSSDGVSAINADKTSKWNFTTYGGVIGLAIGSDGTIYASCCYVSALTDSMFYAINPDGTEKWSCNLPNIQKTPVIGADGTIYVTTYTGLYALNPDGTSKWNYTTTGGFLTPPAIATDGTIYIASTDGNLYALTDNGTSVTEKWHYSDSNLTRYTSSFTIIIGADGTIYTGNGRSVGPISKRCGAVYALTPDGQLKWSYELGLPIINSMIGSDGTLYVVTRTSETLWAFQDFVADFAADTSNGLTVQFVDTSSNLPTIWIWNFGDESTESYEKNPVHTYSKSGTYNITLTVINGFGFSTTLERQITVNQIPNLNSLSDKTVDVNHELNFTVVGYDPDGDTLTYSASNLPEGANFNPTTGVFNWTPTIDQVGTYQVTFTASDGNSTISKTITITVNKGNTAPTLDTIPNKTVNENEQLNFTVVGQDNEGNTLTYSANNLPTGANFNSTTGEFTWTPTYDQTGTYHLTFTVSDGTLTDSKETTITVNDVDVTAPTVTADPTGGNYTTAQNVTLNSDDSTATIYYTTDGSDPTTSSTRSTYTGSITIKNTTTLKYAAVDPANNWSPIYTQTYNIKSDVYVNITASKNDPQVGDTVTYTFKLGNNGPGVAENVVYTYVIPEGLEFAGASVDQGTWTYDSTTRTLTWNLGDVEVGDPYLWLDLNILAAGTYNLQPSISVSGYNPELSSNIGSLLVNAVLAVQNTDNDSNADGTGNDSSTDGTSIVNAASTTNVVNASNNNIPMQNTGIPLTGLISALLLIGSGLALGKRK